MTTRRLAVAASVVGLCILAPFVYLWLDSRKEKTELPPPDETVQTPVAQPPALEEIKPPPVEEGGNTEKTEPAADDLTDPQRAPAPKAPDGTLDPVAEAWAVVDSIKANLHEWGTYSTEAEAIMDRLMPVWYIDNEAAGNESFKLLMQLAEYRDPRSAEVFAAYIFESNSGSRGYFRAITALGPAAVPYAIPYFKEDYPANNRAADIFVPIWQTHRELLDGVAKHIVVPELERSLKVDNMRDVRAKLNHLKAALGE